VKKKQSKTLEGWLERFPGTNAIPFAIDRRRLYRVSELYKGYDPKKPQTWVSTFDHAVYRWTIDPYSKEIRHLSPMEAVAERLHDTSIGQAIGRFLEDSHKKTSKPVVGFMGGHGTPRNAPEFRAVAEIARALRQQKFTIVSGGGPGLMEASNFGAFMAAYPIRTRTAHSGRQTRCLPKRRMGPECLRSPRASTAEMEFDRATRKYEFGDTDLVLWQ
jgi:hypothetical protein